MKIPDPAETQGLDTFKGPHRTGYTQNKLKFVIDLLTRFPDATLASGEGKLLLDEIRRLEAIQHDD